MLTVTSLDSRQHYLPAKVLHGGSDHPKRSVGRHQCLLAANPSHSSRLAGSWVQPLPNPYKIWH